jgi:predicted metal-dependent hydrolase
MDARLREGIGLFNAGRFFESHEILEQFYQGAEEVNKPFIEGLIELAVAFRLYTDFGEIKGPVRMIYQALIRFENYQTTYLGIRIKDLSDVMETWAKAADADGKPLAATPKIPLAGETFLKSFC